MNKVVLIGRLTRDPEVKYLESGMAYAKFTLAVNRQVKKDSNEQSADFIPCIAWGKTAENTGNFCSKGKQVGVDGRLTIRQYEGKDGSKKYATEVVCNTVEFLSKNDNANAGSAGNSEAEKAFSEKPAYEDDIPF